jgi:hypothetical protein
MTAPYYPDVEVELTGRSSNAGTIMGTVAEALREHGVPVIEIDLFREECLSGDYNYLLQTCMAWVTVS